MNLWTFQWTRPTDKFQSARVAAPDRLAAETLLVRLTADPDADGILCQASGKVNSTEGVIQLIERPAQ